MAVATRHAAEPTHSATGLQRWRPGPELRWWLSATGIALLVTALPTLVTVAFGPPELDHVGTYWFGRDYGQYQAVMREAASNPGWLVHNRYTAEPHAPILLYPFYVAIGKLGALLGTAPERVFALFEWLGRLALLGSVYVFASTFLPGIRQRRLAWLLTLSCVGLAGWALPLVGLSRLVGLPQLGDAGARAASLYLEINTFGVLLSAPHLMLGLALTLAHVPLHLRAREASPRWLALLGLATVSLSLVHQFNLPVVASVLGVDALLEARARWRRGQRRWSFVLRPLVGPTVVTLLALPMALYNVLLFQADPFWSGTYGAQNKMPASPPWALPVDFGLLLLAAPLAWPAMRSWPADRRRVLLLWVLMGLLWWYVPVPYQRRFAFGVQPGLAVLGAAGLLWGFQWLRQHGWPARRRTLLGAAIAVATLFTPLLVFASLLVSAAGNQPIEVYLWTRAERQAAEWLAQRTTANDVALAHTLHANVLVGYFDGRVVLGHIVATRESDRKKAEMERFYRADTSRDERSDLLRSSGAAWVALGPRERQLGLDSLDEQPDLRLEYDRDGVQWYRVVPTPTRSPG